MVNYKIAPSDQAPPKLVVRLYNAFNNGTLCAADLSIKKYVLQSQTGDTKEKETKIGEDGELTIRSREEDTVNCGSCQMCSWYSRPARTPPWRQDSDQCSRCQA